MVLNSAQNTVFVLSEGEGVTFSRDPQVVQAAQEALKGSTASIFPSELTQKLPVISSDPFAKEPQACIPFMDNHVRGAAVIACPERFSGELGTIQVG